MRMMKKGNKGAALVSVLVATTFMTVLITTLLYMSYMNYLTKSMRHTSTDNFYTGEFALDDLATSLQQYGADNNGKDDVVAYAGGGSATSWIPGRLQSLINVANREADITVGVADGKSPVMDVKSSSVTFKNVKINSKTFNGDFVSNIVSDITLAWPEQPLKSYGIYDFSLITDSQIDVRTGQVAIGGCLYCRQQPDKDCAIRVESSGVLNLNSPFGVVHGKIIVEDGGALSVGGDIYVTGGIEIQEGGVLFVTGNIEYAGVAPEASRMKGLTDESHVKKHPGSDAEVAAWVNQFDALAGADGFTKSMVNLKAKILKNDGVNWFYAETAIGSWPSIFWNVKFGENRSKASKALADGGYSYGQVLGSSLDTFNSGCFSDSLVLSNSPSLNIRGDLRNSTIIEAAKDITLILDIQADPTYLGRMTEESYEKAKDILFDSNLDINSPKFVSGHFSDYKDDPSLIEFSNSGSDFSSGTIHYYRIGDKNVLPLGNLITPDAETNVATLLDISQGGTTDPKDSFIIYNNWYKE